MRRTDFSASDIDSLIEITKDPACTNMLSKIGYGRGHLTRATHDRTFPTFKEICSGHGSRATVLILTLIFQLENQSILLAD